MKLQYGKFVNELANCLHVMQKGESIEKSFNLVDEDCGYNIVVELTYYDDLYYITVNGVKVYATSKNACVYYDINEMYKILDIIHAVNKFIR